MLRATVSCTVIISALIVMAPAEIRAQTEGEVEGLKHRVERLEELASQLQQSLEPTPISVNCGAGQTIGSALATSAGTLGPIQITVTGVCRELVTISRDDVTIQGATQADGISAPSTGGAALSIDNARHITIRQLTVAGGMEARMGASFSAENVRVHSASFIAVGVNRGSKAVLTNVAVEDNPSYGILVGTGGHVTAVHCHLSNNAFGLFAGTGSSAQIQNSTVENNHEGVMAFGGSVVVSGGTIRNNNHGVLLLFHGTIYLLDGPVISGNEWGISANGASAVTLQETTVRDNRAVGITASNASFVGLHANVLITGNGGDGVSLGDSTRGSGGSNITITNNNGWGINCGGPATSGFAFMSQFVFSGNLAGPHNCN
jgi:hypothetical protein